MHFDKTPPQISNMHEMIFQDVPYKKACLKKPPLKQEFLYVLARFVMDKLYLCPVHTMAAVTASCNGGERELNQSKKVSVKQSTRGNKK